MRNIIRWLQRAVALGLLSLSAYFLYVSVMIMLPPCFGGSLVIAHVTVCVDDVGQLAGFLSLSAWLVGGVGGVGLCVWPWRRVTE